MGTTFARLRAFGVAALLPLSSCADREPTTPESSAIPVVAGFTSAQSVAGFCPEASDAQDLARGYQSALRDVRRICRAGGGPDCDAAVLAADAAFGALQAQHQTLVLACTSIDAPAEVCDGVDNDDDPGTLDGADDPLVGTACDGPDSDLCTEGAMACTGGGLVCSDLTADNVEVCNGLDDDCDGATDEGGVCG